MNDGQSEQRMFNRVLELDVQVNFRDIGGYVNSEGEHIRWKRFYRSAALSNLTESDIARVNSLRLNRILDLRQASEIRWEGLDRIYPGNETKYDFLSYTFGDPYLMNANVPTELAWDIRQVDFNRIYINILENNRYGIREAFNRFTDPNQYPILVHCTQGKDRTGVVVCLLLLLLGIPESTILEDYMLTQNLVNSNEKIEQMRDHLSRFAGVVPEGIAAEDWAPFFTCLPEAMENLLEHLRKRYKGAEGFLQSIGIDPERQQAIRHSLLDRD